MRKIEGNTALKMDGVAIVQIASMENKKEERRSEIMEMVSIAFELMTTVMVVGSVFALPIFAMIIR